MTRRELLEQLREIRTHSVQGGRISWCLVCNLIEEVEDHGVLDVQAPPEIVRSMELPGWKP